MNISQRSLVFSLMLHCSLVMIGTFWLLTTRKSGAAVATLAPLPRVKLTVVKLAEAKEVPNVDPSIAEKAPPRSSKPVSQRRVVTASKSTLQVPPSESRPLKPVRPLPSPKQRPQMLSPYPLAKPASSTRPPRGSTASKARLATSRSAPLWSPPEESEPKVPPADASPAPPEEERPGLPPAGDGDGAGVVVEARPIGRVDLNTPGFMALKSAEIVARFDIAASGELKRVVLDPGTGIPQVDEEILVYLRTIAWSPKTVGGVAVPDVQELDFSKEAR